MNGAGIIGMGLVVAALAEGSQSGEEPTVEEFRVRLGPLKRRATGPKDIGSFLTDAPETGMRFRILRKISRCLPCICSENIIDE